MQRIENKDGQLKVNSLADWEPMELSKNWSDVVAPPASGDKSVRRRLYGSNMEVRWFANTWISL